MVCHLIDREQVIYLMCLNVNPVIVSYTQRRKQTRFIYLLKYDCTTFTSRVNVLIENTVRTEGIQITL